MFNESSVKIALFRGSHRYWNTWKMGRVLFLGQESKRYNSLIHKLCTEDHKFSHCPRLPKSGVEEFLSKLQKAKNVTDITLI